jgi:hypothetical protein
MTAIARQLWRSEFHQTRLSATSTHADAEANRTGS